MLENIIKKLEGNILFIGLSQYYDVALNNKKILKADFLDCNDNKIIKGKKKIVVHNKHKTINIKKLSKRYKFKTIDTIVVDIDILKEYLKYFIKDSIYMCKNKIIIKYENYDEELIQKYQRYNVKIDVKKEDKIIIIENNDLKKHYIKNKFYFLLDSINNVFDYIVYYISK
jgi:hypothetical protein